MTMERRFQNARFKLSQDCMPCTEARLKDNASGNTTKRSREETCKRPKSKSALSHETQFQVQMPPTYWVLSTTRAATVQSYRNCLPRTPGKTDNAEPPGAAAWATAAAAHTPKATIGVSAIFHSEDSHRAWKHRIAQPSCKHISLPSAYNSADKRQAWTSGINHMHMRHSGTQTETTPSHPPIHLAAH